MFKAYLWLAPYVIIALLAATVFYYRAEVANADKQNIKLSTELTSVTATAKQQEKTINTLLEMNAAKDKIVSDIVDNVASINENTRQLSKDIGELKESDTDVKTLLDTAIPPELNRLLNR